MLNARFQNERHQSARKYTISPGAIGRRKRNHSAQQIQTRISPLQPPNILLNLSPLQAPQWIGSIPEPKKYLHHTISTCRGSKTQFGIADTDRSFHALSTPGRGAVDSTEQGGKLCQAPAVGSAWENYRAFGPSQFHSGASEEPDKDDIPSLTSARSYSTSSYSPSLQTQQSKEDSVSSDIYNDGVSRAHLEAADHSSECDAEDYIRLERHRTPFKFQGNSMIRPRSRPHLPRHSRIKSACTLRNKHPCTLVLSRPSTSISTHQPTSGTLKTCKSARSHTQVATLSPSTAPNRAGTNLKRFDHINKALLTTRNPPQIPVRGIKPQPSRVDCKVLSAQMACKENQQRNRLQKSKFLKMVLRKHFPPQEAIEAEEQPIVLDGWSFPVEHTFGGPNPCDTTDEYVMRVYHQVLEIQREKSEQDTLKRLNAKSRTKQQCSIMTGGTPQMDTEPRKSVAGMQPKRPKQPVSKRCTLSERELYHRYWSKPDLMLQEVTKFLRNYEGVWDEWQIAEDQDSLKIRLGELKARNAGCRKPTTRMDCKEIETRPLIPLHTVHLQKH